MVPAALYLLALLVVAAAVWSHLTPVDVFVKAPGVVRPDGDVVRISPERSGRIQAVVAGEGDEVRTGDVLIQLDGADHRVRRETLEGQIALRVSQLEQIRLKLEAARRLHSAELSRLETEIRSQRRALERSQAEFLARLERSEILLDQARKEHATTRALFEEGLVSADTWSGSETGLRLSELEYAGIRAGEPDPSSLDLLETARQVATAKFAADRQDLEAALYPIHYELAELRLELSHTIQEQEKTTIRSPTRGRVTLFEHIHPGEYLAAGTVVGTLEPAPNARVVEAVVANRNAEDVRPRQQVRLLMDDSRVLGGQVRSVSPDVRLSEPAAGSYRVIIVPESGDLRLGLAMEVRFVTRTETVLGMLVGRIRRSVRGMGS